jgi:hypothetical protein
MAQKSLNLTKLNLYTKRPAQNAGPPEVKNDKKPERYKYSRSGRSALKANAKTNTRPAFQHKRIQPRTPPIPSAFSVSVIKYIRNYTSFAGFATTVYIFCNK